MLSQLSVFMRHTESRSARQTKIKVRQKFDYHISIDRPVCKEAFLALLLWRNGSKVKATTEAQIGCWYIVHNPWKHWAAT